MENLLQARCRTASWALNIKAVGSIEFCMIFAVTAFNLIVVTRRIRPDSKALKSSVTRRNTCNYRPSIFVCLG